MLSALGPKAEPTSTDQHSLTPLYVCFAEVCGAAGVLKNGTGTDVRMLIA